MPNTCVLDLLKPNVKEVLIDLQDSRNNERDREILLDE